jgi:pyruvate formate lyase activating enzyme
MQLRVHSWETFGVHDGPGIRLVVFLQGCNLRCLYCHNPDTQDIHQGQWMSSNELISIIKKELPYLKEGGITLSGGEPTIQAKAITELFTKAKALNIHTALDTNGTIEGPDVENLYALTDLLILDVKHIDPEQHHVITGHSNAPVFRNAARREQQAKPMWLRYVLVPGLTDAPEHIYAWGRHFESFACIERVEILPYHTLGVDKYTQLKKPYALQGTPTPTRDSLASTQRILQPFFKNAPVCIP